MRRSSQGLLEPPSPVATPRQPVRGPVRRRSFFWRYRRVWFLFGILVFTALAGAAWVLTQVPLPPEAPQAQTTVIYDATGAQLATLHGVENRFPVSLDKVPPVVTAAVVSAEDRKFFVHKGIDPLGIGRALWADIRRKGVTQGGSTITQQYVKNAYVGTDYTLWRKIREAVISVKIERKFNKNQILERYLNTVYFGRGAYGIQAAAHAYFGKPVTDLTAAEGEVDRGVLDAVRYHSLGLAEWDMVGRILYCADFLDPERPFDREGRAELAERLPRDPGGVLREDPLPDVRELRSGGHGAPPR